MSDLQQFFDACRETTDRTLDELIPQRPPSRLYEAVRWSVFAGGKRFRPALVFAVGNVFGVPAKKLRRTAAAVEMIHTYSLIHDDLPAMDDDDLRRGRATCHKKFDEATAILAGDVLQTLAFRSIAEDQNLSEKIRVRLLAELARAAARMVDGQQLDLDGEGRKISLEDLEMIHQNKTGAMICVAARAGALIAEAGETTLNAVTDYALSLGLLFQITDDLLDITQTTAILGKTAGKDERAEKATYPSLYGVEESRKLAQDFYDRAIRGLDAVGPETDLLRELAEFILHRQN